MAKLEKEREKVSKYNKDKEIVFFYRNADGFSQFHPSKFTINGIEYSCCEQYMMHQKAVLFKDEKIAEQILKETVPREMKQCGRRVKNFEDEEWTKKCRDIVFDGNYAKFSQNEKLKEQLLKTEDKLIAEASPSDKRWGIGLSEKDPKAKQPHLWRGKNWLGEALMRVRGELLKEKE